MRISPNQPAPPWYMKCTIHNGWYTQTYPGERARAGHQQQRHLTASQGPRGLGCAQAPRPALRRAGKAGRAGSALWRRSAEPGELPGGAVRDIGGDLHKCRLGVRGHGTQVLAAIQQSRMVPAPRM
eukprot:scaffold1637_cov410-Prasinococcus_capsulatus_cf.AAC.16